MNIIGLHDMTYEIELTLCGNHEILRDELDHNEYDDEVGGDLEDHTTQLGLLITDRLLDLSFDFGGDDFFSNWRGGKFSRAQCGPIHYWARKLQPSAEAFDADGVLLSIHNLWEPAGDWTEELPKPLKLLLETTLNEIVRNAVARVQRDIDAEIIEVRELMTAEAGQKETAAQ